MVSQIPARTRASHASRSWLRTRREPVMLPSYHRTAIHSMLCIRSSTVSHNLPGSLDLLRFRTWRFGRYVRWASRREDRLGERKGHAAALMFLDGQVRRFGSDTGETD